MEHEENQHLDIREKLLRLPKIQADENFLKRLQIQIDILDSEEKTRDVVDKGSVSGYFKNLFGARLVPALGISSVVVAAFLVYFLLADKKDAVVNNMTNNKNTETVITHEKPVENTTSQPNTNQDLAKKEVTDSKNTGTTKTEETQRQSTESTNKVIAPKVSDERTLSQEVTNIKSNTAIDVEQSGKLIEPPTAPLVSSEKKSEDKLKDSEPKKEKVMPSAPITSTDKEKSINEGGRGKSDTNTGRNPQSSPKPKKKDLNGIMEIDKSVLETLRDKLK